MDRVYWVVGTSPEKYINEFINLLKKDIKVGDKFLMDYVDIKFLFNGEVIQEFQSKIVARQRIDVWEGMGFISRATDGYKVMFDIPEYELLISFSKLFLTRYSKNEKANDFRTTTLINILVEKGIMNSFDLNKLNIRQTRGELTIHKIEKLISSYEKEISKDKDFVMKAKEVIYG